MDRHPEKHPLPHPVAAPGSTWMWPAMVLVLGLLITAAVSWFSWAHTRMRDLGRFENAIQRTSAAIEAQVEVYIGLLRATAGFFAAHPTLNAHDFHAFTERIDLTINHPGTQGIGWAPRVPHADKQQFVAHVVARDARPLTITPAGDRAEYYPIVFLEPMDRRNRQAIGYDMFSEPVRHDAMARARDEGQPIASGRVVLVQEIDADKQAGFLIYVPVYGPGPIPQTIEERRREITGFVYSPFRAGDLLGDIIDAETMPRLHFEIYDGSEPAADRLLYRTSVSISQDPLFAKRHLHVADRTWTVLFRTTTAFAESSARRWTAVVALSGILISGLFGAITLALARSDTRAREKGRELFDQREQLRVTLSSIGDAVISTDARGRIVFMNGIAEQLTGWPLHEAAGRPLPEVFALVDEQTRAPAPNPIDVALQGRTAGDSPQSALISRAGAEIPIEERAAPMRAENGRIVGVVLVFRDVAERRRAEESLRASETRKVAILRSALDAIITIDHESRVVEFNPAAEQMFGYTRQQILGHSLAELIIPERLREGHYRGLAQYLATGEGPTLRRQIELPALRSDGTEFPAELAIVPIAEVQPQMFTVFLRDISARKRAEQQLRDAGERFRFMAESMPQKIFTARPGGEFDYFNQQWTQFTGFTVEELQREGWARIVHPDDLPENLRRWDEALASGEPLQLEHRIRRHDGAYRWHLTRAHALRDAHAAVRMWIGSNTDIDDQKRAEERLEKAVAERTTALRETNEQLEAFVYTIAHDLRGPLRSISGFSQLLAEDYLPVLDDNGRHLLQRVQGSAEFMDRLILDLLAFGRMARAEIELGNVDSQHAWSIAVAQTSPQIDQTHARVEATGPFPLVRAHEATLGQVLANLLANALKFVAPGVRPHVRFHAEDRGANARLWVEDNGIGIAPEMHERVFRVFERLHGTRFAGTGIGLSIVRTGVERMGGHVGVESEPGRGSRFWIDLPKGKP